ncbi:GNAT family N-acetyltransferase [Cellulomonas palmilytica]|uniref:GNAT family N-acetyltransferase n=1 Tax=Cellulomonas palmilytica TaxID=2608402 RepID=UPI00294FF5D4|nr:GNAT family N-acetyltransferase [Cellulomonas palmilytica]UJP40105.1 GNAT family N-acetyltransferase [Cellulomonas palmilytica]
MATPEFILALREKIGTDPLWLTGATAVVVRDAPGGSAASAGSSAREVLLVRRADTGAWSPVGGIVDPGEEPAVAAAREVLEEAAVHAEAVRLALVEVLAPMTYANGDRAQYLDLVFLMRWVGGEPYPADGENLEAAWFPLDALPPLSAAVRARLDAALSDEPQARFRTTPADHPPLAAGADRASSPVETAADTPDEPARRDDDAPARTLEPVTVRRAGEGDAAALTRLRRLMLQAMGVPRADEDDWQATCTRWFAERLAAGTVVAFVVDGDRGDGTTGPVACAVGDFQEHAPEPWNPSGRRGHVFNVSTEPAYRRRGYARATVMALMTWFHDETEVTRVGLSATPDGRAMYEHLGFAEPFGRELVWRIAR